MQLLSVSKCHILRTCIRKHYLFSILKTIHYTIVFAYIIDNCFRNIRPPLSHVPGFYSSPEPALLNSSQKLIRSPLCHICIEFMEITEMLQKRENYSQYKQLAF